MPMKVNVGLSKKVGLPDYRSLGASSYVEIELDGTLLQNAWSGSLVWHTSPSWHRRCGRIGRFFENGSGRLSSRLSGIDSGQQG